MEKTYTETEIRAMRDATLHLIETFNDHEEEGEVWQGILEYYARNDYEDLWDYEEEPKPSIFSDDFRETLRQAHEFFLHIEDYIRMRGKIDPTFKNIQGPRYARSLDLHGDSIDWEWQQSDRCGDYYYLRRSIPFEHLWAEDPEALIRAELEAEEQKKRNAEEQKKRAVEEQDRKKLRELLTQYPEEATSCPST